MRKLGLFLILLLVGATQVIAQTADERQDAAISTIVEVNDRQEGALGVLVPEYDRLNAEVPKLKLGGGQAHDMQARQVGNRSIEGVITLHFLTAEGKYPTPEQVDSIVDKLVVRNMKSKAFWANVRALAPKDWTWIEKPGVSDKEFAAYKKAREEEITGLKAQIEQIEKKPAGVTAEEFAAYKKAREEEITGLKAQIEQIVAMAASAKAQSVVNGLELNAMYGAVTYHTEDRKVTNGDKSATATVVIRVPNGKLPNEEFLRGVVRVNADVLRKDMSDNVDSLTSLVANLSKQVDGVAKATVLSTAGRVEDSLDTLEKMYGKDWISETLAETPSSKETKTAQTETVH